MQSVSQRISRPIMSNLPKLPTSLYLCIYSFLVLSNSLLLTHPCLVSALLGLTSSHRRTCNFLLERRIGEHLNAHSDLCVFWPGALSTRHPWRAIGRADVYTRKCFSESMGSWFGGPGQKALPAMNEFTMLWIFASSFVPLTYQPRILFIVTRSLISLRYAVCSTRRWSILGRCVGACQQSNCAEERQP